MTTTDTRTLPEAQGARMPLPTDASRLSSLAYDLLLGWLEADGNRPSDAHKTALRLMVEGFAALITGQQRGRIAYPLPPGAGKSLSIVATITAMHRLGLPYTCAVAAERVESLCDLIRDLQTLGRVPECLIGLVNSKLYNPTKVHDAIDGRASDYASIPATPHPELAPTSSYQPPLEQKLEHASA